MRQPAEQTETITIYGSGTVTISSDGYIGNCSQYKFPKPGQINVRANSDPDMNSAPIVINSLFMSVINVMDDDCVVLFTGKKVFDSVFARFISLNVYGDSMVYLPTLDVLAPHTTMHATLYGQSTVDFADSKFHHLFAVKRSPLVTLENVFWTTDKTENEPIIMEAFVSDQANYKEMVEKKVSKEQLKAVYRQTSGAHGHQSETKPASKAAYRTHEEAREKHVADKHKRRPLKK